MLVGCCYESARLLNSSEFKLFFIFNFNKEQKRKKLNIKRIKIIFLPEIEIQRKKVFLLFLFLSPYFACCLCCDFLLIYLFKYIFIFISW